MAENPENDLSIQSEPAGNVNGRTVPARWGDIFLYLIGTFGTYLLLSFGLVLVYQEINLTVTVISSLLNFLCFTGGVYLFGVRRGKLSWEGIGLIPPQNILFSVLAGGVLAVLVNLFRYVVVIAIVLFTGANLDSLAGREEFFMVGLDTWPGVLLNLVGIGVLAPIAEELFFRGLIYDWFRQKMPIWLAVLFSSLLFGLGHYDSWLVMVSTFIMGVALALAYQFTKSIWIAISIHIFTNAGAILLMLVFARLEEIWPEIMGFLTSF